MKNNEKIMIGVGLASLSLLAYNTYLNRKQAQMAGALGEIIPNVDVNSSGTIETVSSVADSYFKKAFSTFETIKENPQVQDTLKDLGVDVVVKDLTLDRAKNILSAYAIFKIMTAMKSNALKIAVVSPLI